jgi:hypothetical protein
MVGDERVAPASRPRSTSWQARVFKPLYFDNALAVVASGFGLSGNTANRRLDIEKSR